MKKEQLVENAENYLSGLDEKELEELYRAVVHVHNEHGAIVISHHAFFKEMDGHIIVFQKDAMVTIFDMQLGFTAVSIDQVY